MPTTDSITSADINKVIRQRLTPILKANGFSKNQGRNYWGYHGDVTWVLIIRAVGGYFSDVTGWPSMSVGVHLGVWNDVIPQDMRSARPIKIGPHGDVLPLEYQCPDMFRSVMNCGLDQAELKAKLRNPAERVRTDLWWIEPDGSNVDSVVENMAAQFLAEALPWYQGLSDLDGLFHRTVADRDCYNKYLVATFLAKRLGLEAEYADYSQKLRVEAVRIGHVEILEKLV